MRIGLGTKVGKVSLFASKSVDVEGAAGGCMLWLFRLVVLPFWLVYLYIKWCIKNNSKWKDAPVFARPWAITTIFLIVLFTAAGIWAAINPDTTRNQDEAGSISPSSVQETVPTFFAVDGYDMVQSLFLSLESDGSTYQGFMENVKGSGLEYTDRFISGGQLVEVWADKETEEYTNKLEVTFYNVGDDDEYIRTAEYWYNDSMVRISLHNDFEPYEDGESVLCIIDANEKDGARFKTTYYDTILDAMNAIAEK